MGNMFYPLTTDLPNVEKHQVHKYNLQELPKMFLHISFKTPTVNNLLLAKTPFITFVIIYKWRF